jgi:uncharacterized protein Yka (UPF0111/DUF47 family)
VREVADATRRLPEIERVVEGRFDSLLERLDETTQAVQALIPLLERQGETTVALLAPLETNVSNTERTHDQLVGARVVLETMQPELVAIREAMGSVERSMVEIREVVEPLSSASSRIGRLSDRLPGSG